MKYINDVGQGCYHLVDFCFVLFDKKDLDP